MKTDREENIKQFVFSDNSMLHKAKRYDEDVKYLLNQLYDERRRHARCEEDMMVYNPAEISKVMRLELLDNIVDTIIKDYNRNPFVDFSEEMEKFNKYVSNLQEDLNTEKRTLGKIFKLFVEHYNRPSAC